MLHRNFRFVLVIIMCALLLSAHPIPFDAQSNTQTATPDEEKELLARTAALNGYSAGELELADLSVVKLVNGDSIKRVKAVDPKSGVVVGAAFLGDQVVDEKALRAQAATEWRAEYGALTPDVVTRMSDMSSEDTLDVAVWLVADVQPLSKQDHTPAILKEGTASTAVEDSSPEFGYAGESKHAVIPLPYEQVPDSVKAKAVLPVRSGPGPVEYDKTFDESEADFSSVPEEKKVETRTRLAQIESFKQQNEASLREQLAPVKERFLEYVHSEGLRLSYNSENTPSVFLEGLTLEQLETLSRNPDIDAIYGAYNTGWPALDVARETQNGLLVSDWGSYTGDGVKVAVVETGRPTDSNPYLAVVSTRDTSYDAKLHPTLVGGIIASTHGTFRGFAPDVDLYMANAGDNPFPPSDADFQAARDWGSSYASILNNSYAENECGITEPLVENDRHLDYIVRYQYDLAVAAAGNRHPDCNDGETYFVASPGKGYNTLTVGAYDDKNDPAWSGDVMRPSSQYNETGRNKPEMVASGENITSLSLTSPWTDTAGGTSLSSPMVAATAANMVEADPSLNFYPEAITAVLMATALHNIEGDERLSRADGVGSLDASAALVSVERGHWGSQIINSSTVYPLEYIQFAYKGERVRYVIRWLSNPDAAYTTDPLPADLDLRAYRADGTTLVESSLSYTNNFEIVDFIAPASENYIFKVHIDGSYSGDSTWLGRGWWRGTYRYSPETGYYSPKAPPMGFHLSVFPTDWSPTNYWRAMGVRPVDSDHDLRLYSRTIFDDPGLRNSLQASRRGGDEVDFITVDGNHWNSSHQEQYVVRHDSGTGGYRISWSNPGIILDTPGFYGPYTMDSDQVVKVFDARFGPSESKRIMIIPDYNDSDLGVRLFRSNSADTSTWYQAKTDQVASADSSTSPNQTESFVYTYTGNSVDYLGLVVYSNNNAPASFYIHYAPHNSKYLPLITR